ncbi:hypothetical protein JCM8097_007634 [Rhodosporidiobolus ruineniae]
MATLTLGNRTEAALSKLTLNPDPDVKPDPNYKYSHLLPQFNKSLKLPPLEPFEHVDPGHAALTDSDPQSFLKDAKIKLLSPNFGAEVEGVDLTKLDSRERSQLALYVAQRGVVVFRGNQRFIDADPEWQVRDWTTFFGRPHIHPVSGQPEGFPELHLVYRDESESLLKALSSNRLSTRNVHSDVTYELQPPGLTALFLYAAPPEGGADTIYFDQVEAYNRLSEPFKAFLETLEAEHSGFEQAAFATARLGADSVKRQPVKHVHPLVRTHPVTKRKALFVNPGFTKSIVGLKQEESDAVLKLLFDHIAQGHDFQIRAGWAPEGGDVTLWDNRVTAHSASESAGLSGRRHGARLTPQAERPFLQK